MVRSTIFTDDKVKKIWQISFEQEENNSNDFVTYLPNDFWRKDLLKFYIYA